MNNNKYVSVTSFKELKDILKAEIHTSFGLAFVVKKQQFCL